jgi:hypothetical protein
VKDFYKLSIFNILFTILVGCVFPIQTQVFVGEQNNIMLGVVDYAESPYAVLYYKDNQLVRADDYFAKGIHPLRIVMVNNTKDCIEINPKSIFLTQYSISEDVGFVLPVFVFCSAVTAAVTGVCFWNDYRDWHPYGYCERAKRAVLFGAAVTFYATFAAALISLGNENIFVKDYILHKPIVIEPGKKIETLVLLERTSYKRLFNFRVFTQDSQDIAAVFDVDLRTV